MGKYWVTMVTNINTDYHFNIIVYYDSKYKGIRQHQSWCL